MSPLPRGSYSLSSMNDTRNILDKYKGWETDLVREDVQRNVFPFSVCMINLNYDFNFSTVLRNANAFGAKHVYYLSGSRRFDKRGAVGTNHYTMFSHIPDFNSFVALSANFNCVAVELVPEAIPMDSFEWPDNPVLMVFGSEGNGLSKEVLDICPYKVYIPMHGSVRSLNTACASAIAMNDYVTKYKNL